METQGKGSVTYNVRAALRMTRHGNSRKRLCNIQCESSIEDDKAWKAALRMTRHGNSRKRLCNIQCESSIEDDKAWKLKEKTL